MMGLATPPAVGATTSESELTHTYQVSRGSNLPSKLLATTSIYQPHKRERSDMHSGSRKAGLSDAQGANRQLLAMRRRRKKTETELECPTGNSSQWIKTVTVKTVNRKVVSEKYKGSSKSPKKQSIAIIHFALSTVKDSDVKKTTKGKGDAGNREHVPSTAAAMGLHNDVLDQYNSGFYAHDHSKKINNDLKFGGGSLTRDTWWRGDGCYAMASYAEVKQDSEQEFIPSKTYAKAINLRVAKFSVCKGILCATRKLAMDCWIESVSGDWVQCDHWKDAAFVASVLARA